MAYGIGSDAIDRSGEGASGNAADRSGLNIIENLQPTLRARANNSVAHTLRAEGCDASEDGTGRGTPLAVVPIDMRQASRGETMTNNRSGDSSGGAPGTGIGYAGDPAPTLADSHTPAVAFNIIGLGQQGKNHAYETDVTGAIQHKGNSASGNEAGTVIGFHLTQDPISGDVSPALGTGSTHGQATAAIASFKESQSGCRQGEVHATINANKGSRRQEGVFSDMMVRRLTPLECCRLQGFPDDWLDLEPPLSDSAKYRMLGNAVCRKVARWLGQRIALVLGKESP